MPTLAEILASKFTQQALRELADGKHPRAVAADALSGLAAQKVAEAVAGAVGGPQVRQKQQQAQRVAKAKPINKDDGPIIDAEWHPL
jgi:hypothetical protein